MMFGVFEIIASRENQATTIKGREIDKQVLAVSYVV